MINDTEHNLIRRFIKEAQGNVSIMFAVAFVMLVALVGAAVDYSRFIKEHQNAQDSVDNAALAAAVALSRASDMKEVDVKQLVKDNLNTNKTEVFGKIEIIDGVFDPSTNEIIVDARVKVKTEFMGIIGTKMLTAEVQAVSGPVGVPANIDIVLVLDNTASIGYQDLNALVAASDDLVDFVFDNRGTANIRIGIVPFSRFVNVGSSNLGSGWINFLAAYNPDGSSFQGCVHPYFDDRDGDLALQPTATEPVEAAYDYAKYPYSNAPASAQSHPLWWKYKWDTTECNLSEVTALSSDRNYLKSRISQIKGRTGGSTYIPSGLKWGHGILQETSPLSSTPTTSGNNIKIMVLMTDGGNKLYWIREQESPEDIRTDEETDGLTGDMCESIKASGIHLMTVGFKFDKTKEEFERAGKLLRNCASSSGSVYNPTDRNELKADFELISERILQQNIRLLR